MCSRRAPRWSSVLGLALGVPCTVTVCTATAGPGEAHSVELPDPFLSPASPALHEASVEAYASRCRPQNVHLGLHRDATRVSVMWSTTGSGCNSLVSYSLAHAARPNVLPNLGAFSSSQPGNATTFQADDMCGEPATTAEFPTLWLHSVTLTDLRPNREYWYCPEASSRCFRFQAPPAKGEHSTFSFIMYGDMGVTTPYTDDSPMAYSVLDRVEQEVKRGARFVLHVGDVSYADGHERIWSQFMHAIERVTSQVAYMVSVGNHDYDYSAGSPNDPLGMAPYRPSWGKWGGSGGECGVPLTKFFGSADDWGVDGEYKPFWYSYTYGSAHFVVISAEVSLEPHSTQWKWLVNHLASVDRCETPWLVVAVHRPLYVPHPHHKNRQVAKHLRKQIEDVLIKYGVDVVLSGHVHAYSRTCPVVDKECTAHEDGGILHVVAGSGGHKLSKLDEHQPKWVDAAERTWGFVRATVDDKHDGSSELTVEFVRSEDGSVGDRFTLTNRLRKQKNCSYCYSRHQGPLVHGTQPACSPSTSTSDLGIKLDAGEDADDTTEDAEFIDEEAEDDEEVEVGAMKPQVVLRTLDS